MKKMLNQIIEMSYESFQNLNSSWNKKTAKCCEQLNEDTDAKTDAEINAEINVEINAETDSDASDTHINILVNYNKAIDNKMTKYVNMFIQQLLSQNNDWLE